MAPVKRSPQYREWLAEAVETSGLSKREIARRMATRHPRGVTADTIDTARRTVNKILAGDLTPTQPTRDSIAAALARADGPAVGDEEEEPDLAETLHALAREQSELSRKLDRALRGVKS
jgi:transcriptional regulator with XRE-family HTH domain